MTAISIKSWTPDLASLPAVDLTATSRLLLIHKSVTNPSPIRWGGPENKDDVQLRVQAAALEKLGRELRAIGLILSYHNHDIELRNAAREFHHMMVGSLGTSVTVNGKHISISSPHPEEYQGDKSDFPRFVESDSNLAHNVQEAALDLAGLSVWNLVLAGLAFWAVSRCDVR
ncbi:MAG: hypothetical protein A2Z25_14480 [Planctomycetes bacterium RBG_16_55_9]|nr:MAG: hypothetical protein A2Z25_14480 [Planctomycetes bacterium RBG_16_55_9]